MKLPLWKELQEPIKRHRYVVFAFFLWQRFRQFRLTESAASLTYTTLLALVPLFTVMLIMLKAFPMFSQLSERFKQFMTHTLVPSGVSHVETYLQEFSNKAGNLTIIGILLLAASALLLMMTIEKTFNRIWQVKKQRPLLFRLLMYWTVITLGPLGIGLMSSLWTFVFKPSDFLLSHPVWAMTLFTITSILFYTVLLAFLYRIVPNAFVPVHHAMLGGFLTAVVFEIVRRGFGWYVHHFNSYELIYGTFAIIPLFLIWLFFLWAIVLGGAVLTAGLSHWHGEAFRHYQHARKQGAFVAALSVLDLLNDAHAKGKILTIKDFRKNINLGYDAISDMLYQLENAGWVIQTSKGWLMKTDAQHIPMKDIFHRFVYQSPSHHQATAVQQGVQQLFSPLSGSLNDSLGNFLAKNKQAG